MKIAKPRETPEDAVVISSAYATDAGKLKGVITSTFERCIACAPASTADSRPERKSGRSRSSGRD